MPATNRPVSQFLLISGRPEIIRQFQTAADSHQSGSGLAGSRSSAASVLEVVTVSSTEAAERTLHRSTLDGGRIRVVVVDSVWVGMSGTDVAAMLWAHDSELMVVECTAETCNETLDLQVAACVQPRRFALLRVPFSAGQAGLLIRNLVRAARRDEQFAEGSRSLEALQERVEQLECDNSLLTAQVRRNAARSRPVGTPESGPHWCNSKVAEVSGRSWGGPTVRRTSVSVSNGIVSPTENQAEPAAARCQSDEPRLSGRVLVADDHPASRRLMKFLLERAGVDVTTCQDGAEALRTWHQSTDRGPFDAVVLDNHMPGLSGPECARQMREAGYRGPLLAVTGRRHCEHENSAEDAFDDWLIKPLDRNEFVRRLRELLAGEVVRPDTN